MEGQTVSHYRILEKIGQGGMGVVYLAEDTSLERKVALKFLPTGLQADPVAHKRFIREAKSAAAIDHPFICNIFEVGQSDDGQDFIVMEYVEGQTLKDRLEAGQLPDKEALQIGSEVAEALEKAHGAGVVHRDLKPSNIIITPEGHAKVLDFGLAKRITRDKEDLTSVLTREGTTLGTLAYMSPEQLRGSKVDTRSDVFSLGVVLYEMFTGLHPFSTGTQAETVNAILSEHPSPVSRYIQGTPDLLQHTLQKMLAKQPGERYQTVHEIRTNLAKVMEEITSPTPLAEPEKKSGRWIRVAVFAVLGIALITIWWNLTSQAPDGPVEPLRIIPITAEPAAQFQPTFSPDGEEIAFAWEVSDEKTDIHVRRVDGEGSLQLTDHPGRDFNPAWSPDGGQIAFWRHFEETSEILTVSPMGGRERKLVSGQFTGAGGERGLSWSPDGKLLAYTDRASDDESRSIYLLSIEDRETRRLKPSSVGREDPGLFYPVFSPDGQYLATWLREEVGRLGIVVFPLEDGDPQQLFTEPQYVAGLAWTSDSKEIVFSSSRESGFGYSALWRIPISGGDPRRIDAAGEGVRFPAISRQGDRLSYSVEDFDLDILKVDLGDIDWVSTSAYPVIASTRIDANPDISPDGTKITFSSGRTGEEQIWVCNSDGSDPIQLTDFGNYDTSAPRWSPDGRFIAFNSNQSGHFDIYVMDSQGGGAHRLTTESSTDANPTWSQDGRWIYFQSDRSGAMQVWRVPAEGGDEVQVTTNGGLFAEESTDGTLLYYSKADQIWRMPLSGGEETLVLEDIPGNGWALTEEGIYFFDLDTKPYSSFRFYDFDTEGITHLGEVRERLWTYGARWMCVAPGGDWLLCTSRETEEDIMLMENFQ